MWDVSGSPSTPEGTAEPFTLSVHRDLEEYKRAVQSAVGGRTASGTVLFSNHRTGPVDIEIAHREAVPVAVVFRALAVPDLEIRALRDKDSRDLALVAWQSFDWVRFAAASAIVGVSNACIDSIRPFMPGYGSLVRIYNPVGSEFFECGRERGRRCCRANSFLIASRLVPWKRIDVALTAFIAEAAERPWLQLDVIGEGPDLTRLRRQVRAETNEVCVRFHGWQRDPLPWFREAGCLLHPCGLEAFGRVVAEALASGLPVLGADEGGVGELLAFDRRLSFRGSDPVDCRRAIRSFLETSVEQRTTYTDGAHEWATSLFTEDACADQYLSLAERINGDRGAK